MNCSTWTPGSWGASAAWAIAFTGDRAKNRNRGIGCDVVHLTIEDHSRVSHGLIKADDGGDACAQFLREAVAHYASLGVRIERVMTDNNSGYVSKAFKAACIELQLMHVRTRPYTPKTIGKAERFVQTSCVSGHMPAPTRAQRSAKGWSRYNGHRPHTALGRQPRIFTIPAGNNLLRLTT